MWNSADEKSLSSQWCAAAVHIATKSTSSAMKLSVVACVTAKVYRRKQIPDREAYIFYIIWFGELKLKILKIRTVKNNLLACLTCKHAIFYMRNVISEHVHVHLHWMLYKIFWKYFFLWIRPNILRLKNDYMWAEHVNACSNFFTVYMNFSLNLKIIFNSIFISPRVHFDRNLFKNYTFKYCSFFFFFWFVSCKYFASTPHITAKLYMLMWLHVWYNYCARLN